MLISRDRVVAVGMGGLVVSRNADQVLAAYGLGSCVGLAGWDPVARVGGLAHVVLPDSAANRESQSPGRFADTAVPALLDAMTRQGADIGRLVLKMAGGAQVLALGGQNGGLAIGERNVAAVRQTLRQLGLPLAAEDTGGNSGRTLLLQVGTGRVTVQIVGRPARDL